MEEGREVMLPRKIFIEHITAEYKTAGIKLKEVYRIKRAVNPSELYTQIH